jgi:hypothetical protein
MKKETEQALVEACQHAILAPHGPLCAVARDGVDLGTNCTCHVQKARAALQLYGAEQMSEGLGAMMQWWTQWWKK